MEIAERIFCALFPNHLFALSGLFPVCTRVSVLVSSFRDSFSFSFPFVSGFLPIDGNQETSVYFLPSDASHPSF